MLRKRADLHAMPKERKQKYREIIDKARKSTNVEAILKIADALDEITATGAARSLRERAAMLKGKDEIGAHDLKKEETSKSDEKKEEKIPEVTAEIIDETTAIHGE
jgi:hypothetical protein